MESDIIIIKCPFCGELVPARIDIAGHGVNEGLVEIGGYCIKAYERFPIVELAIGVNLGELKNGGLEDLIARKRAIDKELEVSNTKHPGKRKHK